MRTVRPLPVWDPALDDVFVVTAVRRASPGMTTLLLAPRRPATVAFDAGQHVSVEFELAGERVTRTYTVASPPTRPERLEICVGRRSGGRVSPQLGDAVTVGSVLRVGPPQGTFTLQAHPADAYLLLTAGSGVTPALSMVREVHDLGREVDMVLVHAQREPAQIPFSGEWQRLATDLAGLRIEFVCSSATSAEPGVRPGRLDQAGISELVPDAATREAFVCGPDSFRAMARSALVALGCDPLRVHEESFSLAAPSDVADLPEVVHRGLPSYAVEFRDLGATINCPPGATVLSAAVAAGLDVPWSCGEGLCGTCKHTLAAGEVDMQHAGGIRPRDIAGGRFLLCCSRPLTDLVIMSEQQR